MRYHNIVDAVQWNLNPHPLVIQITEENIQRHSFKVKSLVVGDYIFQARRCYKIVPSDWIVEQSDGDFVIWNHVNFCQHFSVLNDSNIVAAAMQIAEHEIASKDDLCAFLLNTRLEDYNSIRDYPRAISVRAQAYVDAINGK